MKIYLDCRAKGPFGIGRFTQEVASRSPWALHYDAPTNPFSPFDPLKLPLYLSGQESFFISTSNTGPIWGSKHFAICIHDLIQLDEPQFYGLARFSYMFAVTRFIAKRAAIVFTVSEFSKSRIVEWFGIPPNKIIVLGNAVSPSFLNIKPAKQPVPEKFFLSYSSTRPHKNLIGLIESYLRIMTDVEEHLIVVGSAPNIQRKFFDVDKIHFISNVDDAALVYLLKNATSFIFPSFYEGFGIPVLESMSCGCPVITSNNSALTEVSGSAALLVDPKDNAEIARAMIRVANFSYHERKSMILRGYENVGRYSWDEIAGRLKVSIDNYVEHLENFPRRLNQ